MKRLSHFIFGFLLGGITVYVSLHFHLIRAENGVHFVPKLQSTFSQTYVDVRNFGVEDWNRHRLLTAAVTRAGKTDLFSGAVVEPVHTAVDEFFQKLN